MWTAQILICKIYQNSTTQLKAVQAVSVAIGEPCNDTVLIWASLFDMMSYTLKIRLSLRLLNYKSGVVTHEWFKSMSNNIQ